MSAPSSWDDSLATAFDVILERPVRTDPGTYAAWYCCHDLPYELFDADFDPRVLADGHIARAPFTAIPALGELLEGWDLFAAHWSIDLGASLFFADDDELVPGLTDGLSGRELGRELVRRGIAPPRLADSYPSIIFRLHTDGSLFDALRTLTGTHRGPTHLHPLAPAHGVRERWRKRFADLDDPALTDHLSNLFRTEDSARSAGAYHLGTRNPSPETLPEVVTAWRFGEGQAWSAVTVTPATSR